MVRQRTRKGIEDLYGNSKIDKPLGAVNIGSSGVPKPLRTEREYAGYLLQANAPYIPPAVVPVAPMTNDRRRRPVATSRTVHMKTDKLPITNNYPHDEVKKDMNSRGLSKVGMRQEKPGAYSVANHCDNKCTSLGVRNSLSKELHRNMRHLHQNPPSMHQQHQQQQHRNAAGNDVEKDDETDEFFELIKQTVENAVGKTIAELLNRNFRDLSAKIDRFSAELKSTNALLNKLQTDINHKVVHYGEENSRHFRYLCMKSEYDKMFYQHHTNVVAPTSDNGQFDDKKLMQSHHKGLLNEQQQRQQQQQQQQRQQETPCTCRTSRDKMPTCDTTTPSKTTSEDPLISQKDAHERAQQMLELFMEYCSRPQAASEDSGHMPKGGMTYRGKPAKMHEKSYEDDDDDDIDLSSESTETDDACNGGNTMRGGQRPAMGAGDN